MPNAGRVLTRPLLPCLRRPDPQAYLSVKFKDRGALDFQQAGGQDTSWVQVRAARAPSPCRRPLRTPCCPPPHSLPSPVPTPFPPLPPPPPPPPPQVYYALRCGYDDLALRAAAKATDPAAPPRALGGGLAGLLEAWLADPAG
jgi:hypothetical protein